MKIARLASVVLILTSGCVGTQGGKKWRSSTRVPGASTSPNLEDTRPVNQANVADSLTMKPADKAVRLVSHVDNQAASAFRAPKAVQGAAVQGAAVPQVAVPQVAVQGAVAEINMPAIGMPAASELANAGDQGLQAVGSQAALSLGDYINFALNSNPTIQQATASLQKATGFRTQVSVRPNPTMGYQAVQMADLGTDQHTLFAEQEFVTGNKLNLNRQVLNETVRAQQLEVETQRARVTTDVGVAFFQALAAQRRIELVEQFKEVAAEGLRLAELRSQALEGTRIEILQAEIQKNEIDLQFRQAEIAFTAKLKELNALCGIPWCNNQRLAGELPREFVEQDWDFLNATILSSTPEYQIALAKISKAQAALARHCAQAKPNVTVQLATGFDNGTDNGLINFQIGAPIPTINKNQGNIAAARAEYCRASQEAKRVADSIRLRVARVSQDYDASAAAVARYRDEILPMSQESLELAEKAYRAGETSFVLVLTARRTYFETNLRFLEAQAGLAQAGAKLEGSVLSGALAPVADDSGDTSLRDLAFGQQ